VAVDQHPALVAIGVEIAGNHIDLLIDLDILIAEFGLVLRIKP
jgi:hypothetical protein